LLGKALRLWCAELVKHPTSRTALAQWTAWNRFHPDAEGFSFVVSGICSFPAAADPTPHFGNGRPAAGV